MPVGNVSQYPVPGLARALSLLNNCSATLSSTPQHTFTHQSTTCTASDNRISCTSIFTAQSTGSVSSFTYTITCGGNNVVTAQYQCQTAVSITTGNTISVVFTETYSKQF